MYIFASPLSVYGNDFNPQVEICGGKYPEGGKDSCQERLSLLFKIIETKYEDFKIFFTLIINLYYSNNVRVTLADL